MRILGISTEEVTTRRLRYFSYIVNLSTRSLLNPSGSKFVVTTKELEIDESSLDHAASL